MTYPGDIVVAVLTLMRLQPPLETVIPPLLVFDGDWDCPVGNRWKDTAPEVVVLHSRVLDRMWIQPTAPSYANDDARYPDNAVNVV